jgi:cyclic pyranopterin phosphate synthase
VLVDRFRRIHDYLRLSITDRCNLRCAYCMPAAGMAWLERDQILSFEEIARLTRVCVSLGVGKVRITGGEPLVRRDVVELVARLARIEGVRDLSLTTNGVLLDELAAPLRRAGLARLNVSLDSLTPETFERVTRRNLFDRVMRGIEAADAAGFHPVKLNMVVVRGLNDHELEAFATLTRRTRYHVRFLEYMPLDGERRWARDQIVTGAEILARLARLGPLETVEADDPSDVARRYRFRDGRGEIGLILPVSQPFCHACSRLRITAEGAVKNCLFGQQEWNARDLMRAGASDDDLRALFRVAIRAKRAAFGGLDLDRDRSQRSMSQIGG